jgi:predicted ATPase
MTPLTLHHLERPQVEAVIARLANGKTLPAEVIEHIVSKTDGVPLFVEELTKMLLESTLLREEVDHYALTGPLAAVTIPTTLYDSLMARLDRLPTVREVARSSGPCWAGNFPMSSCKRSQPWMRPHCNTV